MTDSELDALVAEKVFGGKAGASHWYLPHSGFEGPWFSKSIASAWLVVEKMRARGFEFLIGNSTTRWRVAFHRYRQVSDFSDALAPRAICLAALKALGVELSQGEGR